MADILHSFQVKTPPEKVFESISTPRGLDAWWTKTSEGKPMLGEIYQLSFGPVFNWTAMVSKYLPNKAIEYTMKESDADWTNTKVGFSLADNNNSTNVEFYHSGWKENNEHFRISSYCWAMYLRILKRYIEFGEKVPYENRLNI